MAEYVLAMTGEAVNAALTKAQTDVSFSQAQSLTDAQKAIARNNIGAMETKSVVEYTTQSLNDQQKQVARQNIGAGSATDVTTLGTTVSNLQTASGHKLDYTQTQSLTDAQKTQTRQNIGLNPVASDASMTMPVGIDANGQLWAESLEEPDITNWAQVAQIIKSGAASKFFEAGDQFVVNKATSVTAAVKGNITGATVSLPTFITQMNEAEAKSYTFSFINGQWVYNGNAIVLSDYGITVTGTPASLDTIVITETVEKITFDVLDFDYDTPVTEGINHTMSLLAHDVYSYSEIPFDASEALFYVDPETYPSGLPVGTYHVTLDHGTYGEATTQDGTYQFTTTQIVPAGGLIRHTTMGVYQSSSYTKAQITGGKFVTYNTEYTQLESLTTTEGSGGTSLGTTTARRQSYRTNELLNFTERNGHGSNNWLNSSDRQYLNSDAAGAASGAIASWWTSKNIWDMPVKSTKPGFLYGLDPSFRAILQTVKKRNRLTLADYGSSSVKHVDNDERVFFVSQTEVNLTREDSVYENSFGTDKTFTTIKTTPYALYASAGNADRIKYQNGTARYWWLRGPYPSNAYLVRYVSTDGSLDYYLAYLSSGVVPALCVG